MIPLNPFWEPGFDALLQCWHAQERPGDLVKMQVCWDLQVWISLRLSGNAPASGPRSHIGSKISEWCQTLCSSTNFWGNWSGFSEGSCESLIPPSASAASLAHILGPEHQSTSQSWRQSRLLSSPGPAWSSSKLSPAAGEGARHMHSEERPFLWRNPFNWEFLLVAFY